MDIKELEQKIATVSAEIKSVLGAPVGDDGKPSITKAQLKDAEAKTAEIADLKRQLADAKAATINRPDFPTTDGDNAMNSKTLGQTFVENGKKSFSLPFEAKAVFSRSAGMAPERHRNGHIDFALLKPLGIFDVFDVVPMYGDGLTYQRETISAGAAEAGEAGSYNEAGISYDDVFVGAKKVTVILPATDEVLSDNAGAMALIDGRLSVLLRERFESQYVAGAGTGDLMTGLIETSSTQTYTRLSGETRGDAMIKGASKIREAKAGNAKVFLMNPADYTKMRLEKDDNGRYLYAELRDSVNPTLDGKPVVLNDSVPANKVVAVDTDHVKIGLRADAEIEVGYNADDFSKGKRSVRGQMRGNTVVYRTQAIVEIDITDPA